MPDKPKTPGRPPLPASERGSAVNVSITPAVREFLLIVGGGRVSRGARIVLTKAAKKAQESSPPAPPAAPAKCPAPATVAAPAGGWGSWDKFVQLLSPEAKLRIHPGQVAPVIAGPPPGPAIPSPSTAPSAERGPSSTSARR